MSHFKPLCRALVCLAVLCLGTLSTLSNANATTTTLHPPLRIEGDGGRDAVPADWRAVSPVRFRRLRADDALPPMPGLGQMGMALSSDRNPLAAPTAVSAPYSPAEVVGAYGLPLLPLPNKTGAGVTIAIVDAYGDSSGSGASIVDHAQSDLQSFCGTYGLPYSAPGSAQPTLTEVFADSKPTASNSNWAIETALDIEWAHAIAPAAHIVLVVSPDNGGSLYDAVGIAEAQSPIISMSWGGGEFNGESTLDQPYFGTPNVTYFAATGDSGAGVIYPSASPNVTAIGGTSLHIDSNYNWLSETAWSGSGGGIDSQEGPASFQSSITSGNRSVPDVAAIADPNTGVVVVQNGGGYWVGGTSLATPVWAGFTAIVDGNLPNPIGETSLHSALYNLGLSANIAANYHDIISGSNGAYTAVPGYDYVTGFGSPKGNVLLPNIVAYVQPITPTPTITPNGGTSGASFTVSIGDTLAGTTIKYTLDGTNPATSATAIVYGGSFIVNRSLTVEAIATAPNYKQSGIAFAPFTVTQATGPTITGFTPSSAQVGSKVSINGTGFTGATGVTFNNVAAAFTVNSSGTQIMATVPANATTGLISVTTPVSTAKSASNFVVAPTVLIYSFSPPIGTVQTLVTISGANFANVSSVLFNGTASNFTTVSSHTITANVPTGATSGPITVVTATGVATTTLSYAVRAPKVPVYTNLGGPSISPFTADTGSSANGFATTTTPVSITGVVGAAPAAVYQSQRVGASSQVLSVLAPGTSYTLTLHFAEFTATAAGQRKFNASANGVSLLSNFDVFAAAGGKFKAVVMKFPVTANASGQVTITFSNGSVSLPIVNGLELH